ncbi:Plastocyanin-like domain-containing protein [Forsythia ovata]|uniref:Plastocyanin-like domain-containing protein n=1 Tax=Forsythia ovata TaxID=205694 RepID=A0ABD1RYQ9_9LAMI
MGGRMAGGSLAGGRLAGINILQLNFGVEVYTNPNEVFNLDFVSNDKEEATVSYSQDFGTCVLILSNMHLRGCSFYVVSWCFGNFDPRKDPSRYNLVDLHQQTTVGIPNNGWVAI